MTPCGGLLLSVLTAAKTEKHNFKTNQHTEGEQDFAVGLKRTTR